MLTEGAAGTATPGTQYAMLTQDQYSPGSVQTSAKRGGKCACFGGTSKMVGASTVDSRQTQAYGQSQEGATMSKSRGKCPCFGGSAKMLGAVPVTPAADMVQPVQGNVA